MEEKAKIFTAAELDQMSDKEIMEIWPDATIQHLTQEEQQSMQKIRAEFNQNSIKQTAPQNVEPKNEFNINSNTETMSPEELKQKYPEACQAIFNAGKRAGIEADRGKLPEPGTDPELDALNAEVDKILN